MSRSKEAAPGAVSKRVTYSGHSRMTVIDIKKFGCTVADYPEGPFIVDANGRRELRQGGRTKPLRKITI